MAGPHYGQPILHAGQAIKEARAAMILLHGRGATADSILELAQPLFDEDMAYLAPQASDNTWYPFSFLEPLERNEPQLSSALERIEAIVAQLDEHGLGSDRVIIGGFSQGGCLALEFVARHAQRYGGAFAFSGGIIGPDDTPRDYAGDLEGTPVFIGCADNDFHIPKARVIETEAVLDKLGAVVDARLYPGMGHTIIQEEIDAVQAMIKQVMADWGG